MKWRSVTGYFWVDLVRILQEAVRIDRFPEPAPANKTQIGTNRSLTDPLAAQIVSKSVVIGVVKVITDFYNTVSSSIINRYLLAIL